MSTKEWVRLYPVPFRTLEDAQKFKKYQPIRARVQRPRDDRRPESWRVDADSIQVIGSVLTSAHRWKARRPLIEPVIESSMCGIRQAREQDGTSLAMFRPREVSDLVIEAVERDPEKGEMAAAFVSQGSLLGNADLEQQRKALEQIPYRFQYSYRCSDKGCSGHLQSIVDWEIAALYRRVRDEHDWQGQIKAKWLEEMCGAGKDTAFIVGNQHQHPDGFLILGVWWPPMSSEAAPGQLALGDSSDL
jgi:hypothetical protein